MTHTSAPNTSAVGAATFANGRKHAQPNRHYDLYAEHPELLDATPQQKAAGLDVVLEDFIAEITAYVQMLRRSGVPILSDNYAERGQALADDARGLTVQLKRFTSGLTGTGSRRWKDPRRPIARESTQVESDVEPEDQEPAGELTQAEARFKRLLAEAGDALLEAARERSA